ncbi:MAG: hypothetical protein OSB58_22350 [Alphaproteobacteria bacterium]|nr:hypothetical protein [Alphaproteobacteria bacterium]
MLENASHTVPDKVLETALIFFGFVGMVTPLALWITWSEFTFYLVLSVGFVAISVFVLLSWYFNARNKDKLPKTSAADRRP